MALALSKALICGRYVMVTILVACYYTHTFMHFKYIFSCDFFFFMQVTLQLVFVVFQRVSIISRLFLWAVAGDILDFLSHSSFD